ncbi:MAG: TIGR03545 family protein, partial [Deltaproteobacteria bacterium]|nr:TIGR03545 family protein [Deltaproteobacteria bacterium]
LSVSLNPMKLLDRKLIGEEMIVTGVKLNTPRKKSGAIKTGQFRTEKSSKFKPVTSLFLPSVESIDIEQILAKENLQTLALIQSIRKEIPDKQESWQQKLNKLPDKEQFEQYRKRIDKLKGARDGDLQTIISATAEVKSIRVDLTKDINSIKSARDELSKDIALLKTNIEQAKQAPVEDARRLKEKYSPSAKGLGNVSNLLFGEKIGTWVERSLSWYERLKPFVQRASTIRKQKKATKPLRAKGIDVHFKEYEPLPEFLIHRANVSVHLEQAVLSGKMQNITPEQDVLGSPLIFEFASRKLEGIGDIHLTGIINHIKPEKTDDVMTLSIEAYPLKNIELSSSNFPLVLDTGLLNLKLKARKTQESIRADIVADFTSVRLSGPQQDKKDKIAETLLASLAKINNFTLKASIFGTPDEYDLKLDSDLDKLLSHVVGEFIEEYKNQLENELKTAIQDKAGLSFTELEKDMSGFNIYNQTLTSRLDLANNLLQNELLKGAGKGLRLPF